MIPFAVITLFTPCGVVSLFCVIRRILKGAAFKIHPSHFGNLVCTWEILCASRCGPVSSGKGNERRLCRPANLVCLDSVKDAVCMIFNSKPHITNAWYLYFIFGPYRIYYIHGQVVWNHLKPARPQTETTEIERKTNEKRKHMEKEICAVAMLHKNQATEMVT